MEKRASTNSILLGTGKNVRIAVLDSGVNPEFSLLRNRHGKVFNCYNNKSDINIIETNPFDNSDRNGHGSCVETCIRTVAPDVIIDHYRILDENTQCSSILLCYVLDHVVGLGYHIVNLSLGTSNETHIPWLVSILKRAYEGEVTIVAASSNVGNSLYPARFPECISCEAMPAQHPLQLQFKPRSVVEFAGWGVNIPIEAPNNKTIHVTGSSYAAAHVTGLAARYVETLGVRSCLDIKLGLRSFAQDLQNFPCLSAG